jgi:hypothetical protein
VAVAARITTIIDDLPGATSTDLSEPTRRRMGVRIGCVLALVITVALLGLSDVAWRASAEGVGPSSVVGPARSKSAGHSSACGSGRTNRFDYCWPVRPFNAQHPIRGNFGDPRTVSLEPSGVDGEDSPGAYSFHNGVDIAAAPGTLVYPVVSGIVDLRRADEVIVRAGARDFQYWHIHPTVRTGVSVLAGKTVLGHVLRPADHVHLSEIDWGRVTNPARHLRPYHDQTSPLIDAISVRTTSGNSLPAGLLSGRWRQPGRYLFQLTRQPLDTNQFPNGNYTLRVVATDICGNRGTLTQSEVVSNKPADKLVSPSNNSPKRADGRSRGSRPAGTRRAGGKEPASKGPLAL